MYGKMVKMSSPRSETCWVAFLPGLVPVSKSTKMGSKPITRAYSSYSAGDGSEWCSPSVIGDLNNLDLHNAASATLDSVHLPTPSKRNSRTLSAATINESDISMSDLSGEASLLWSNLSLQVDLSLCIRFYVLMSLALKLSKIWFVMLEMNCTHVTRQPSSVSRVYDIWLRYSKVTNGINPNFGGNYGIDAKFMII